MTRRVRRFAFFSAGAALVACGLDVAGVDPAAVTAPTPEAGEAALPPKGDSAEPDGAITPTPDGGDGGCGDTTGDLENCGACGHSCRGNGCNNGVCLPDVLEVGLNGPLAVAVQDDVVYVAENSGGRIYRIELDGGLANPVPIFDTMKAPRTLAVTRSRLYWTEQLRLRSIQLDGAAPDQVDLSAQPNGGTALAIGGNDVFFNDNDGRLVLRRDLDLGGLKTVGDKQDNTIGIATTNEYVFWTSSTDAGAIVRLSRDGGSKGEVIAANELFPESITAGPDRVFWTTPSAIRYTFHDGGAGDASVLYDNRALPRSLVRCGGSLYWFDVKQKWLVGGVTDGTSPPLILAVDEAQPDDLPFNNGIACDNKYVYWVSNTNGTLKRVAR